MNSTINLPRIIIYLKCFLIISLSNACKVTNELKTNTKNNEIKDTISNANVEEEIIIRSQPNKFAYISFKPTLSKGKIELKLDGRPLSVANKSVTHFRIALDQKRVLSLSGSGVKGEYHLRYPIFTEKEIKVQENNNLELLCLTYFLSELFDEVKNNKQTFTIDGNEIAIKQMYALNNLIGYEFSAHKGSPILEKLSGYFEKNWYLNYAQFVSQLSPFPFAESPEKKNNSPFESPEETKEFIQLMNKFYLEIDFNSYSEKYRPYYRKMITEVQNNLPGKIFITEMEHFYQEEQSGYFLMPSLTMPFSQGYALGNSNGEIGFCFGGVSVPDQIENHQNLILGFNDPLRIQNVSVHEFGHSFVNHNIENLPEEILNKSSHLYNPIEEEMTNQGYSSWSITLSEHFVRAGEIFITRLLENKENAQKLYQDYTINKGFKYIPLILKHMDSWYHNDFLEISYKEFVIRTVKELAEEKIVSYDE